VGALRRSKEVQVIFPDELKAYMAANQEGTYTLLDVRQPHEYEEAHLPGARLLPLPRLADSLGQMDSRKPTIVYCAVGGRSSTAAQMLMHQGFTEVMHLQGGIDAWEEPTATGPVEFHLEFVRGGETPAEIVKMAYRMEAGLKRFHEEVLSRTEEEKLSNLLRSLVKAEEKHMETVLRLAASENVGEGELAEIKAEAGGDLMEGGGSVGEFLTANERFLHSVSGFMELAMMVETQALDLYLRMAAECRNEATRKVLLAISEEEKGHLAMLGRYMDQEMAG
jgi:rhodanese-related sulfurtransferase/rubrerythrin